jgi:hypothetical protein
MFGEVLSDIVTVAEVTAIIGLAVVFYVHFTHRERPPSQ